jgi:AcrR family transcriptional regulator
MKAKRLPTPKKTTREMPVMPLPETAFEVRRLDVLRRSALVFAEDGFHQTSVNSLAARLGVSKPVLYYYAKNKDDLLYQCDAIVRDALFKAMESTHRTKISGMGKVRHFFNHYAEIMCGDFGRCLALVDHRALNRETRQKQVSSRRGVEEAVCQMILEGQADGSIAHCNPQLAARVIFGAFNGIPRWFQRSGELKASDVAETYIDLLITGLGRH